MDEQDMLQSAMEFYGQMFCQVLAEQKVKTNSKEEEHKLKIVKLMVKKKKWFLSPLVSPVPIPTPESTIETFPLEMFGNFDKQQRRNHFFSNFRLGDIVIGKVINVKLPNFYKLLILHKHGEHRKLDDLSLLVFLPKEETEQNLIAEQNEDNEIKAADLLRVVVCGCNVSQRMFIVSKEIIPNIPMIDDVPLGKVSSAELPFYVGNDYTGLCLVDVLHRTKSFYNPSLAKEWEIGFKIDRHKIHSLHEELDGIEFPKEMCAEGLRKSQDIQLSEKYLRKGTSFYNEEKISSAFDCFKKAIALNKNNVEAYVSRGIAYANDKKMSLAIQDLEAAIKLNAGHNLARKTLSEILVIAAKTHKEQQNIEAARVTLELAMTYDKENPEAKRALSTLDIVSDEAEESTTLGVASEAAEELSTLDVNNVVNDTTKGLSTLDLEESTPPPDLKETSIPELEKKKQRIKKRLLDEISSPQLSSSDVEEDHEKKCNDFLRDIRKETDRQLSSHKQHHKHTDINAPDERSNSDSHRHRRRRSSSRTKKYSPERRRSPNRYSPPNRRRYSPLNRRSSSSRRYSPPIRKKNTSSRYSPERRYSPDRRRGRYHTSSEDSRSTSSSRSRSPSPPRRKY